MNQLVGVKALQYSLSYGTNQQLPTTFQPKGWGCVAHILLVIWLFKDKITPN